MGPRDLLVLVARVLHHHQIDYFVTGSMGAMMYGEFRLTNDVDIVIDLRREHVPVLIAAFSHTDYYLSEEAALDAIQRRSMFNLIHQPSNLKVDFIITELSRYNDARWARTRWFEIAAGFSVRASSPEDLILKKLQFYQEGKSDKHLRDIASMIKTSGASIDRAYLERWAHTLGVMQELIQVTQRAGWSGATSEPRDNPKGEH